MNKYVCEFIGTFALVFFGCATVIFMRSEVGLLGVAFAFGLTVVAMAYSIGSFPVPILILPSALDSSAAVD